MLEGGADLAERMRALNEAVEADEAFRNAVVEAVRSGNVEEGIRLAAEKGIEFTAE